MNLKMNLLAKLLKKWYSPKEPVLGAVADNRSTEDQAKDYDFKEIVAMADPVDYQDKKPREFPLFNQGRTSRCVAFTAAKILGVLMYLKEGVFVPFSALHIYKRRVNKGEEGMIADDCWRICQQGVTLEVLAPSEKVTSDAQNDATKIEQYKEDVGKVFSIYNWVALPTKDIDTIASVIQRTNKAVMVWYYFTSDEWGKEVPTVNKNLYLGMPTNLNHSVAAVDFGTYKGQRGLWIEDSAKFGSTQRRFITADFHNKRNWYAAYPIHFKFDQIPKPSFAGTIASYQDILKYEGLFPTNVDSTGNWLAITEKATVAFCQKYGLTNPNKTLTVEFSNKLKQLYP